MSSTPTDMSSKYQCRLCDKQFEQPQTLALHEKHHQYKFQCGYCARRMKTEREFLRHEATHAESAPVVTNVNKARHAKAPKSTKVVQENAKPEPSNQSETLSQERRPSSRQSTTSRKESTCQPRHLETPSQDERPPSQHGRPSSQQGMSRRISNDDKTSDLQPNEADEVFKKAALFDEIQRRCLEMEKEIETLKTKFDLSDSDEDDKTNLFKVESLGSEQLNEDITQKDDAYEISDSELTNSNIDNDNILWDDNDKTVPKNWKVSNSQDGSRCKKIFKSPEGFVFQTRVKALEFMINGNYPEPLLSLMKNNLADEGWIHDRSCPVQWKTRKLLGLGDDVDFEYLSPGMEVIPSMQDMLSMVQKNEGFDFKDVKNLEDKIASITSKKRKKFDGSIKTDFVASQSVNELKRSELEQDDEEVLPAGWCRKKIGESKVYVSPGGDIVHTIQQVLATLEQSKSSDILKQTTKEEFKPTTAEKRKFEELFTMNKKGKLNHSPKVKQKSVSFSVEQVKILEGMFATSLYPSDQNIEEICNSTSLTEREVKKWFVKRGAEQARGLLKTGSQNSGTQGLMTKQDQTNSGLVDLHLPPKLSDQHISALKEIFKSKPYPTAENFRQISDRLGLERQVVIQWFRKRRSENHAGNTHQVEKRAETKSPLTIPADQSNMITMEQERSLQEILTRTKNPTHQDYKALVISTGLSRLKIERWFNFQK